MEVLFGLFVIFMIVEHPVASLLIFVGVVVLACLSKGEGGSTSSSYTSECTNNDDDYSVPWYAEKDSIWNPTYYSDGTYRYRTLRGFEYSTGVSSWIDGCGIEHRSDGTESRPVCFNDNIHEIYDSYTNELLGIEREEAWGISRY